MKKVLSIIVVAVVATFVACGPSAEEKAKMEEAAKRAGDSISAALSESLNSAMTEATATDSTATTAVETATTAAEAATKH